MRFLPVFLDLQGGVVLLVGAGDLARAKLRVLASAGARVRWYATDGNHDLRACRYRRRAHRTGNGRSAERRSERRDRDPMRRRRR
jgi:uroporphyrin-III C-methyltransferase/precorrin-2 dehydrogenase/sirohydrochlorin ferrochelatase